MIFQMDSREFRLEIAAALQGYSPTNESVVAKSELKWSTSIYQQTI